MNRLILLGNGFDLAHGMKTKYSDFIFSYLKDCFLKASKTEEYSDELIWIKKVLVIEYRKIEEITDLKDFLFFLSDDDEIAAVLRSLEMKIIHKHYSKEYLFKIKSPFLKQMICGNRNYDWVNIENEYYFNLKKLLAVSDDIDSVIKELNLSLQTIIRNLEVYLEKQKPKYFDERFCSIFSESIDKDDIVTTTITSHRPDNILILNFNYTRTVEEYFNNPQYSFFNKKVKINYIHGNINSSDNPMIFGFGDELDEDYKKIESENREGFLNFIKSFWYFKTSNYHDLIRFIDSGEFQVYILGHSCGLSDRTMLNMIYEHVNCKSIKIFYYGNKSENNYTKLTQEISRHFNDKGVMRKKIVPFVLSHSMPQPALDRKFITTANKA